MNYTFKIENLDCANCAAKVETAVQKIDGVKSCSINFFALKMQIETVCNLTDELMEKIQKAVKKVERNVKIWAI